MTRNGYKYRWAEWFAQPTTVLVRGVDYRCSQSSMCGSIRNAASQAKLHVKLTDHGDSITIEVTSAIQHPDPSAVAG